jgi:DNA topoisomerase VI subunit B
MQSPREPRAGMAGAPVSLGGWDTNTHSDPARTDQVEPRARGGQTHALAREVFTTSRLAEFCTLRELEKQTGHSANDWPIYTVKELLDNALDAAEEGGIAPRVEIMISADRITVSDNGPGIAAQTVERLLDLSSRTSARARYVSPTRGAQGQALSTILVMPYALAPESRAGVTIEAHGLRHRVAIHVHPLTEEPRLAYEVTAGSVKIGTRISVDCPSTILTEATSDFLPLAQAYVLANPHLSLTLCTPEGKWTTGATNPAWTKWRACDPTSAHWYTPETFTRLVRAYIQKDQETGRRRPLRDFLEDFDNLSSTSRRSRVLAATALSGARLDNLVCDEKPSQETIAALLHAMQAETKPVKPERLGIIGETHIRRLFEVYSNVKGFKWTKNTGVDANGFPYVVEGAFAWCPGNSGRRLIVGANFASSPGLLLKFNPWESAGSVLEQRHAGAREPLIVFLHVTHPRLSFTDLGKTRVTLPRAVADDLQKLIERITADWHRQRQQEEKDRRAEIKRQDALERARKVTIKESVYRHLPKAYKKASGGVGARSRQIFYQLRPLVLKDTGRDTLDSPYIEQQLIPDFIAENPEICAGWIVFYDDRGHLIEPHTGKVIGLGTKNVRDYCRS